MSEPAERASNGDFASGLNEAAQARADMEALMSEATIDGIAAGRLLKLSRGTTYKALRSGAIPSVRLGNQYRVPTAKLRALLGIERSAENPIAA